MTEELNELMNVLVSEKDVKEAEAGLRRLLRMKVGVDDALVRLVRSTAVNGHSAAEGLVKRAKKGEATAIDGLIDLSRDTEREGLDFLLRSLASLKDPRGLDASVALCTEGHPNGAIAVHHLADRVFRDKKVRGRDDVMAAFLAFVDHENKTTRWAAVKGLQSIKRSETLPALIRHVEDESVDVRVAVVAALKAIGEPSALPALEAYFPRAPEGERSPGLEEAIEKLRASSS